VAIGVANQKVVVRQVDLPWLPEAELKKSLPLQVQDFIPIPVEEAILDYHAVEEVTDDAGARLLRVLLVAATREMVLATVRTVTRAGLDPVLVDLTPFAVLRALVPAEEVGMASVPADAIVDVGASVTNVIVHQAGVPRFVRILLMGGGDVTEALAERIGVPIEHAESVKQQMGMATPGAGLDGHPATRAIEMTTMGFVEEIRGSLDYYFAQPQAVRLRRILLTGGGSRLSGLAERLSLATRLPVERATPMGALTVGKTGLSPEQLSYIEPLASVPVGLAMGVAS
jgi:type IV pilus assembly protein PilM